MARSPRKKALEADAEETGRSSVARRGRTLFLFSEITPETAREIALELHAVDASKGRIRIVLSSGGGDEAAGWAIHDLIAGCRNRVVIEGYGEICSIAALILQAADRRVLAPGCRMMIHNGTTSIPEVTTDTASSRAREIDALNRLYHEALAARSGQPVSRVRGWCRQDTFFSAAEAVEAGLADEVQQGRRAAQTAAPSRRREEVDFPSTGKGLPIDRRQDSSK